MSSCNKTQRNMKHFNYLPFFVFLLISCNSGEGTENPISEIGTWEISEIRSSWGFDPVKGDDIGYRESYEFRNDGTFKKFNSESNITLSGQYTSEFPEEIFEDRVKSFLVLTYNEEELKALLEEAENNPENSSNAPFYWIVYSSGTEERLSLLNDGSLVNAGYGIADGPIFVYLK